jgi:hypothetical protein
MVRCSTCVPARLGADHREMAAPPILIARCAVGRFDLWLIGAGGGLSMIRLRWTVASWSLCATPGGGSEILNCGVSAGPKPESFHSCGVFLPRVRHRVGRTAEEREPMNYYRFAEMAVALSFGLTFALLGWWEIAEGISRALR